MDTKYIIYGLIASAIIVTCVVSVYYGVQAMKKVKENNEYSYGREGEIIITIYHVTWCPYSKKALEVWRVIINEYNNSTTKNGKVIIFKDVNCEELSDTEQPVVNGKPIEAYPTIYCNIGKDKPQIEFKSKCTNITLRKFIEDIKSDN